MDRKAPNSLRSASIKVSQIQQKKLADVGQVGIAIMLTRKRLTIIIPRLFLYPGRKMPARIINSNARLCLCVSLLAGLPALRPLKAQPPVNPLRQVAPISADIGSSSLVSAGPVMAEPPSVVPPHFGPPKPLHSDPLAASDALYGPGGEPDLSQHLVHHWFAQPWFSHSDPNDPQRHVGLGQPLIGTSWRNRPLFAGAFLGGVLLGDLVADEVDQNGTAFMGLRLGHDFDHYWGVELRYAYAQPELADGAGNTLPDHGRDYFADVSLAYYPWGDSYWRPYVLMGLGFQTFRFNDAQGQRISESLLSIPIGIGLKYYAGPWFTIRFDIVDNIALGNDRLSGMNNFALLGGVEYRFGGRRPSYFPWHANTTYW
jgi:hypothetical protein